MSDLYMLPRTICLKCTLVDAPARVGRVGQLAGPEEVAELLAGEPALDHAEEHDRRGVVRDHRRVWRCGQVQTAVVLRLAHRHAMVRPTGESDVAAAAELSAAARDRVAQHLGGRRPVALRVVYPAEGGLTAQLLDREHGASRLVEGRGEVVGQLLAAEIRGAGARGRGRARGLSCVWPSGMRSCAQP